jgi:alpha-ketoglutarate-dependent taurine dioxygenase
MTDAIVIFGTKDQELYAGTQLLKLGYAPLVFVTSDKPKTAFSNFFKTYNLAPEQFIFDRELAVNTTNYSTDTAEFIRKYRLQSMRLVVGSIELPRALLEVTSKIPRNIIIIPHPVISV